MEIAPLVTCLPYHVGPDGQESCDIVHAHVWVSQIWDVHIAVFAYSLRAQASTIRSFESAISDMRTRVVEVTCSSMMLPKQSCE